MQTVSAAFTAAERSPTRRVGASALVSWKKQRLSSARVFTIGVSAIGGSDAIASQGAVVSDWNKYFYFNESDYLTGMSYERSLKMPTGGFSMGMFDARFDNTSGRFTPRYMGGTGELYTSVAKTMRPTILNAGFKSGVDDLIPQFVGLNSKPSKVDHRSKSMELSGYDFLSYLRDRYLDREIMFTSQRSDQILSTVLTNAGFGTSQYDLDYGINVIPFGLFEVGTRLSDLVDKIVEAENGQFYQDEAGILKFENRQHWNSTPYTNVQRILYTSQVINSAGTGYDHIINVVEILGQRLEKQQNAIAWQLPSSVAIAANGGQYELFVNFDNPMLAIDTPSLLVGNTLADRSGTDISSSISVKSISKFAKAAKIILQNNGTVDGFVTNLTITGRAVVKVADVYSRYQDDSSVTAYQPQPFKLENPYIQNQTWANSYAQMLLNDFAEPENLQAVTIRAIPELQLGDLISWQGRYWRIFGIKTRLDASTGFVQDLTMLQRTITTYFRIGISSIGGTDKIAP